MSAADALLDTSSSGGTAKTISWETSHDDSDENETYAMYQARHKTTQEAEMKVVGRSKMSYAGARPRVKFDIRIPATETSSTSTMTMSSLESDTISPVETYTETSPTELRTQGYRLLTPNEKPTLRGVVQEDELSKKPALQDLNDSGPVYRMQYPLFLELSQ